MFQHKFFKVGEGESGDIELSEVEERPLKYDMLDTGSCFILELAKKIYIWCGKEATVEEKNNAIRNAKSFKKDHFKAKSTHISRIPQYGEDAIFKSYFEGFYRLKVVTLNEDYESAEDQLKGLYNNRHTTKLDLNEEPIDKESLKVYRVVDGDLSEVP